MTLVFWKRRGKSSTTNAKSTMSLSRTTCCASSRTGRGQWHQICGWALTLSRRTPIVGPHSWTSANLRKVFDYAARGTWVVLFDEFDAIGRSRDDVTEHGELKRVVNTFLQMLDRFTGRSLVLAATNFEQSLDPAVWRRFDEIFR